MSSPHTSPPLSPVHSLSSPSPSPPASSPSSSPPPDARGPPPSSRRKKEGRTVPPPPPRSTTPPAPLLTSASSPRSPPMLKLETKVKTPDQIRLEMETALTNFITVYNQVSGKHVKIDLKNDNMYAFVIRQLGHYLYVTDISKWMDSSVAFSDSVSIDLHVFMNTIYQERVHTFLQALHTAFNSNLDVEIEMYLDTTDDFTENEKKLCREFHGCLSRLQHEMKKGVFHDAIQHDVLSKQTISSYSTTLREYNEYNKQIVTDRIKFNIIDRFNKMLPSISSKRPQPNIFFDA